MLLCSLSKTRVGGLCCHVPSQKPGSGVLCCLVRSQKPGSGVCVAVFALKNCPCSLSKTLIVFPVVALKNPGRGLVLIVCTLKNPGEGFCYLARSQKPWGVLCRPCSLSKTRVGGLCSLSKTRVGGFLLPCSLSKTRVGGLCCHVHSQKPGSGVGVAMISLKNPGRGVFVCVLYPSDSDA